MLRQRVLTAVVGVLALVIVVFLMPPQIALAFYAVAVLFARLGMVGSRAARRHPGACVLRRRDCAADGARVALCRGT